MYVHYYLFSGFVYQVLWLLMLAWNMYNEMHLLVTVSIRKYFASFWSYLEILNFVISMAVVVVHMTRIVLVDNYFDKLQEAQFNSYVSFAVPRVLDMVCAFWFCVQF